MQRSPPTGMIHASVSAIHGAARCCWFLLFFFFFLTSSGGAAACLGDGREPGEFQDLL